MRQLSGKAFTRVVEHHGWSLLRIQGSHHIYGKQGSVVRLSIPVYGNQALKRGLLAHLTKLAGLEKAIWSSRNASGRSPRAARAAGEAGTRV